MNRNCRRTKPACGKSLISWGVFVIVFTESQLLPELGEHFPTIVQIRFLTIRLACHILEIYGADIGFDVKHALDRLLLLCDLELVLALVRRSYLLTIIQGSPRDVLKGTVLHDDV